jgi:hypothetical protein
MMVKMGAEMETEMKTNQERLEAKIGVNSEKSEVLRKNVDQSRGDESRPKGEEGHVGGLSKKHGSKSRRNEVHSREAGIL